jgi:leader peptidase (prepilin peptidase)/N-methyltransferase
MIASVLLGLVLSIVLNGIIGWQLRKVNPSAASHPPLLPWVPIIGSLPQRASIALVVVVLTTVMSVLLWQRYGWTSSFWLLLGASLTLIDTAAIDWQVRLIDTLVMVGATILALVLAPWIIGSWPASLLGLAGAGIAFVIIFGLAKLLYPQQQAPFGLGDVYLSMFLGALLGWLHIGTALLYGMLLAGAASLVLIALFGYQRARHIPIAYGSFLCIGALLYLGLQPI